jgi:hypothetical protein
MDDIHIIRLHIPSWCTRRDMVHALAESGYKVWREEQRDKAGMFFQYVCFEYGGYVECKEKDGKENKELRDMLEGKK